MTIKVLTILSALLLSAQTSAMQNVLIIDHNEGQRLPDKIADDALVSIFGATPRYSYFKRYMALLRHQLEAFNAAYNKGEVKAFKRIMKRSKKANTGSLVEQFNRLSQEDQFTLFFKIGFHRRRLSENVAALCKEANETLAGQKAAKRLTMVHVLLPVYFSDCAEYKPSAETMHTFLKAIARFYQQRYKHVPDAPEILIYIPPLRYFEDVVKLPQAGEFTQEVKEQLLCTLLKKEFFLPLKQSLPLVLINQDVPELKALATQLVQEGVEQKSIRLRKLILTANGKETTSFTPYILSLNDESIVTNYKTSPLFTSYTADLLKFIVERGAQ